jgi:hypothetical protein
VLKISDSTCWISGIWTEVLMCSCVTLMREDISSLLSKHVVRVNVNKHHLIFKVVFEGVQVLFVSFCYLINREPLKVLSNHFLLSKSILLISFNV